MLMLFSFNVTALLNCITFSSMNGFLVIYDAIYCTGNQISIHLVVVRYYFQMKLCAQNMLW